MEGKVDRWRRNVARDRLKALKEKSSGEHLIAFIKAAFESIPGVGGALSTLIDEYYPNRQIERLISFVEDLARRLGWLEKQVKKERIRADEFGDLLFEMLHFVSSEHSQEKLDAYRAILLNALITPDLIIGESEFFLSLVRELGTPHIQMLRVLYQPQTAIAETFRFKSRFHELDVSLQQILQRVFADAPDGYVDAVWTGLQVRGLVVDSIYLTKRKYIDLGRSGGATDHTEAVLRQMPNALTPFGRRFIKYITDPTASEGLEEPSNSSSDEQANLGNPVQQ